jgi:glycosyltransferase involved in cell wall biosynthesis
VRILHVAQPVEAGVPRVVVDLVADQVGRGWDVVVACPATGWLPTTAAAAGARLVPWEATRSPGPTTPLEARALAAVVRSVQPGVVHLHSAKAGLAGRLAVRGHRPTVFQPHAWSFEAADGPIGAASRVWERTASRWTHLVVAVSEAEAARGRAAGVDAPVLMARNGVDVRRLTPRDRATARAALGLDDRPLAVCVGRLAEQKGQDVLVAAWPAVRAAVPGARLVLVGDGPARPAIEALAGEGVVVAGGSDDPATWYAAADVVAVPSRWEGMALVPLEAMASGRTVVGTDVDGMREALGDDAGAVVPVEDPDRLAAAITARLGNPSLAAREGAAGRARAVALFDVRVSAAAVGDAVAGLASGRG